MKLRNLAWACTMAFTTLLAPVMTASTPDPQVTLAGIHQRILLRQAGTGDFASDMLYTAPSGDWQGLHEFLATATPVQHAHDAMFRVFNDLALVEGRGMRETPASRPAEVRYTYAYARDGSRWVLVSAQETFVKTPSAAAIAPAPPHAPASRVPRDPPAGNDYAVLSTLNARYVEAFRKADADWYAIHLAPDYRVVHGDGSLHDRNEALADFALPYFDRNIRSFPVDAVRIRIFGQMALIHAENAYLLKDGRRGINRYTDIWRKTPSGWRCISAHITVFKTPA